MKIEFKFASYRSRRHGCEMKMLICCPTKAIRNRMILSLHDGARQSKVKRFRSEKISPTRFFISHPIEPVQLKP